MDPWEEEWLYSAGGGNKTRASISAHRCIFKIIARSCRAASAACGFGYRWNIYIYIRKMLYIYVYIYKYIIRFYDLNIMSPSNSIIVPNPIDPKP